MSLLFLAVFAQAECALFTPEISNCDAPDQILTPLDPIQDRQATFEGDTEMGRAE